MLLERGAKKVLCFDIVPPSPLLQRRYTSAAKGDNSRFDIYAGRHDGNLVNKDSVFNVFQVNQIDVVYHIAALVGPFHDHDTYMDVNFRGTIHIIDACNTFNVPRLVFSSSPSTRFDGSDIEGVKENELKFPETFLAVYAETKALAEKEVHAACSDHLYTISVAPHQVYGPHDPLFLPALLETCGSGKLRVFGKGENKISVCYVDNYCHGLICGADALQRGSNALGKFYIITDGPEQYFWKVLNTASVAMGFNDLFEKFHYPTFFLMTIAYIANVIGFLTGRKFKLNPFNVKMLTIHRYFDIENSIKDLNYKPLFSFEEGWAKTINWHKEHWLPTYLERRAAGKGSSLGSFVKKNV